MNSAFSWMASIIGCTAGGLMPGLVTRLLPGAGSYRMAMLLALGLLLAGWSVLLLMKDGKPAPSRRKPLRIRFSPNLLRFTLISALTGVGSGAIVSYFNVYFTKVLGAGPSEVGIVFAVTNALMVAGFAITPRISSRLGKVRATALTQMASIPFLILMALTTDFMVGSFAYTSRMFLMNLGGPALTSLQMEMIDPEERGFAIGFMSTVSGIVVAAAAYLGGLFMAQGNYMVPYAATCVAYVLAAGLLYRFFRAPRDRLTVPSWNRHKDINSPRKSLILTVQGVWIILKEYIRTVRGFHKNVKLLLLRSFLICLYTGIYGILFNLYILNLGYGADFLGLVLSTHVLASSATSIPAGILCDRFDKKRLMVVSGLFSTLAAVPCICSPPPGPCSSSA